jgi:FkbM family methyltransferase
MRTGGHLRCRIAEFFSIVEIYGQGIYASPLLNYRYAKTIVDIGANVGVATIWLSQMAPNAQILAIEPDIQTAKILQENIELAQLANRAKVIVGAVGGNSGTGVIMRSPVASGISHVVPNTITTESDNITTFESSDLVPMMTLLDIVDVVGSIDILKIDCEGSEFDFFGSASLSSLRKIQSIIGEYHLDAGSFADLNERLSEGGFAVECLDENDVAGMFIATRIAGDIPK